MQSQLIGRSPVTDFLPGGVAEGVHMTDGTTKAQSDPGPIRVYRPDHQIAAALTEAGAPVRLSEYVGMPHGYLNFPRLCRLAPQALAKLRSERTAALAQGS